MSSTTITTTPSRKRKPTSSRRLFTKKARIQRASPLVVRAGRGPCPPKTIVTLKYNQNYASPGTTVDKIFNLNSIFSPEGAGGAHQPLGRDGWAGFYNRYRVMKARVTVIAAATTAMTTPFKLTVLADNQNTTYTNVELAVEQQGSAVLVGSRSTITGPIRFTRTYWPHKVTGVSLKEYTDDRFGALFTGNPTEQIALHVIGSDIVGNAVASGAIQYSIIIEYTVEMFDPVVVPQS
jgi:hypothetical protein